MQKSILICFHLQLTHNFYINWHTTRANIHTEVTWPSSNNNNVKPLLKWFYYTETQSSLFSFLANQTGCMLGQTLPQTWHMTGLRKKINSRLEFQNAVSMLMAQFFADGFKQEWIHSKIITYFLTAWSCSGV